MSTTLSKVKVALRITGTDFDEQISDLIEQARQDLQIAGIIELDTRDPLILRAVTTFVMANFGAPEEYDRLKASYDEQKAQLQMASGYTFWGGGTDGQICSY